MKVNRRDLQRDRVRGDARARRSSPSNRRRRRTPRTSKAIVERDRQAELRTSPRRRCQSRPSRNGRTGGSGGTARSVRMYSRRAPAPSAVQSIELARPPPTIPSAGSAEMAEDQRPAEQRVDDDARRRLTAKIAAGPLERRRAKLRMALEQQPRQQRPYVGAEERSAVARDSPGSWPNASMIASACHSSSHIGRREDAAATCDRAKAAADVAHRVESLRRARSPSAAKRR